MTITAVVFDFFGTLTPPSSQERWLGQAGEVAVHLGVSGEALHAQLDASFAARCRGELGDLRATLRTLARRCGIEATEEQLDQACAARTATQQRQFATRPAALPLVRRLKVAGLKTAVLSDCSCELPAAWASHPLAPYIDVPVFSSVEQRKKPDPVLFAAVAERLGTAPAQCLFVGDNDSDELAGARRAGMRAVLLAGDDWVEGDRAWDGARVVALEDILPTA